MPKLATKIMTMVIVGDDSSLKKKKMIALSIVCMVMK